jgi:uncharacterized protein YjiS (DUF1127 family)
MTTLTTNTPTFLGSGLFAHLRDALRRRATFVRVYDELAALNDHELEDIGLSRGMIREVASEAAAEV